MNSAIPHHLYLSVIYNERKRIITEMVASQQVLMAIASFATIIFAVPLGRHNGEEEHSSDHHVDYHAHPKYHYDYSVHDLHTGDVKNKWETRDGDVVKGYYSVNEPDGTIRKVEYTADKHNGFNAVVKRLGKSYHPEPVKHLHYYRGQNSFVGRVFGGDSAAGVGNFGAGGHFDASSYSNVNIHRLGLYGSHH